MFSYNPVSKVIRAALYAVLFLLLIGVFIAIGAIAVRINNNRYDARKPQATELQNSIADTTDVSTKSTLKVNADLLVQGGFYLAPSILPEEARAGQIVFDNTTNSLQYFNGTEFISIAGKSDIPTVQIPSLTSAVTSLQGQSGAVTLTPGPGISINGTTIANSGIIGVNGVAGDINVTTANGIATLSLPQSVAPIASPSFAGLSLLNALSVPNGGTGTTHLMANSVVIGGGAGPLSTVTPAGPGLCLISTAGAPTFGLCSGAASGVAMINGLTGTVTIGNAMAVGSDIIIDDASTSQKGIARFNASNFSVNSGIVNTVQNIAPSASPTFAGLTLSTALSVGNGGTGATTLAQNAVLIGNGSLAVQSVSSSGPGECLVSTSGAPIFTACPGAGGVASLNGQTGALTFSNASAVGGVITIDNASTSQKGIAQFSNQNFSVTSGVVNTIQGIAVSDAPTFAGLTLTAPLGVASGGTGVNSFTADSVLIGNGTGAIQVVTAAGPGQCLISTSAAPAFAACPGGGSGVSSLNALTGIITVANSTGSGSTITIDNASTSQKGIAQFNSGNFIVSSGVVDTIQSINTTASPTFLGLTLTNLTVGSDTISDFTGSGLQVVGGVLQTILGNDIDLTSEVSGVLPVANGGTGSSSASGARSSLGAAASGANSDITSTSALNVITPSGALTVGSASQSFTLQGTSSSLITAADGSFTTTIGFATPTASATINFPALPAGTFEICTTSGNCLGGGGGANVSLSNLSSVAINTSLLPGSSTIDLGSAVNPFRYLYIGGTTTNNFQLSGTATAPRAITFPDASGEVCLDSGNCIGGGGGAPSGASYLTLGLDGALGAERVLTAGLNMSFVDSGANSTLTLASVTNPTFSTSVTTPLLTSGDALAITSGGDLTIGTLGQAFALQGSSVSTISASDGSNTTVIGFADPVAGATINFPALAAGTYTVCTDAGNCTNSGVTELNTFTGAITIQGTADQITVNNNAGVITLSTPQSINTTASPTFLGLTLTNLTVGSDTISDFTGSGLQVVGGVLQTILGNDIDLTSEVSGVLPVANGGTGQATAQAAINDLSGLTTNGDLLYHDGANVTRLARGSNGECLLSTGTSIQWGSCAGGGSVSSVNGDSGTITIQGTTNQVIVNTNSGVISLSTPQDINTSASPTFAGLTLTAPLAVSSGGTGASTASGARSNLGAAASGANADITSTSALNTITPSSSFILGSTSYDFTLQGDDSSQLTVTSNSYTTSLQFITPVDDTILQLPALAAGTYEICTSGGNCVGAGGTAPSGASYLTLGLSAGLTNERVLASGTNISFVDAGSNGNLTISTVSNPTFSTSVTTPLLQSSGALNITPGGTLTVGSTSQPATYQGTAVGIVANGAGSDVTLMAADQIILNAGSTIALQDNTSITGTLTVSSLGAADTATYLCRNSSNEIATCNTTGAGAAFVQGGNSFGVTAVLGTNEAEDLELRTNSTARITIASSGMTTINNGLTVANPGSSSNSNITLSAIDGTNEGAQITFAGAGAYAAHNLDVYQGSFRIHSGGSSNLSVDGSTGNTTVRGTLRVSGSTNTRALSVNGDIAATGWVGAGCEAGCETSGGYALLYANGDIQATGNLTMGNNVRIGGTYGFSANAVGDKINLYSTTYGIGIESNTLTNWSASQFRWRVGGSSVSTGTERMSLSSAGVLAVSSEVQGTAFRDSNNSTYLADPNNISIFNDMRATIYYDYNNTTYYVDGNNTSRLNAISVNSAVINGGGSLSVYASGNVQVGTIRHTGTSGNLHIDSNGTTGIQLNHYGGSGGVHVKNGSGGYGTIYAASFAPGSSRTIKHNIQDVTYGLNELMQLMPKSYIYNDDPTNTVRLGLISEDVQTVIPEAVVVNPSTGVLSMDYQTFIPVIINSVQALKVQDDNHSARITALESGSFTGSISVAGNAHINGILKVAGIAEVASIKVGGKIISAGNAPTSAVGQALTGVLGASITNSGTDVAGTITIQSGSQLSASGQIGVITFNQPYAVTPRIIISGNNAKSAKLGAYIVRTTNGFEIKTDEPLEPNTEYSFDYIIIGTTTP